MEKQQTQQMQQHMCFALRQSTKKYFWTCADIKPSNSFIHSAQTQARPLTAQFILLKLLYCQFIL